MCRRFWTAGISGRNGAAAAADVLFVDYNPGGKLPITVPRSVGAASGLLLPEAIGKNEDLWTAPRCRCFRWLGPELHDVQIFELTIGAIRNRPGRADDGQRGCDEHRFRSR